MHGIYTVSNIQFTYTYQRPDWNSHTVTHKKFKSTFLFLPHFPPFMYQNAAVLSADLLVSHTVFWDDHSGGAWELFYVSVPHCNLGHEMILQHMHTTLTTFPLKHILLTNKHVPVCFNAAWTYILVSWVWSLRLYLPYVLFTVALAFPWSCPRVCVSVCVCVFTGTTAGK